MNLWRTSILESLPEPAREMIDSSAPAPDPKWGRACGRSWRSNIPFAADLKGAFLNGEGVHAFVKPDGHFWMTSSFTM